MSVPSPVPIGTTITGNGQVSLESGLSTYEALAAPFDVVFTDVRGGVSLSYISGEQVVRRLNEVLGVGGWSFRILQHEIQQEADEAWALGELVANIDGTDVTRQQFGSQKLKRSRSTGAPLDIGFDLKGAATDSMKKCASLLGVGLYLSRKEPPRTGRARPEQGTQATQQIQPKPSPKGHPPGSVIYDCEECGGPIMAGEINGLYLEPDEIAARAKANPNLGGKQLCIADIRAKLQPKAAV